MVVATAYFGDESSDLGSARASGGALGGGLKFSLSGFRGIRKPTIIATTNANAIQSIDLSLRLKETVATRIPSRRRNR